MQTLAAKEKGNKHLLSATDRKTWLIFPLEPSHSAYIRANGQNCFLDDADATPRTLLRTGDISLYVHVIKDSPVLNIL